MMRRMKFLLAKWLRRLRQESEGNIALRVLLLLIQIVDWEMENK